jgi:hypothetical protein
MLGDRHENNHTGEEDTPEDHEFPF